MFDPMTLDGRSFLCEPAALRQILARVAAVPDCPTGRQVAKERRRRLAAAREAAAKTAVRAAKGKVGVIPVIGPVDQRWSAGLMKAGGTALEEVAAAFDAMLADAAVSAVVFDIDSPGGSSYGVEELADKVFAARGRKPLYAVANSMAASAAYWLGSAAGNLSVTPGGDVGSVGVYTFHVDESKALEQEGVSVTFVHAGRYKVELSPTGPLTADAKDHLQSQVDATYAKFVGAVARHRGVSAADVRAKFGQGRLVNADDAKAAGMVDAVRSLEDLLGKLTGGDRAKGASAAVLKLKHEHRKRTEAVA